MKRSAKLNKEIRFVYLYVNGLVIGIFLKEQV